MSLINKLSLGTVQFGLEYGIANELGKPSTAEVQAILDAALKNNITTLDTAIAYGDSEKVLGSLGVNGFNVITKIPSIECTGFGSISTYINTQIVGSLARLSVETLSAVLLHNPSQLLQLEGKNIYSVLQTLKESGRVKSIGLSVYDPDECELIIDKYAIDIVQIPFSIIDSRWEQCLLKMKRKNIEIHARSIFLQGLLVMDSNLRPECFNQWSELWQQWSLYLKETEQSAIEACVNYVLSRPEIDKVIVGVESLKQFEMILASVHLPNALKQLPFEFKTNDEQLLNPSNWP